MTKEEDFKSLVKLVMELGELALSLNRRVAKLEGKELPGKVCCLDAFGYGIKTLRVCRS